MYCLPDRLSETRSTETEELKLSFDSRVMGLKAYNPLTTLHSRRDDAGARKHAHVRLWHLADF